MNMLCQNCGKNEANVKYTQIVNGVKKQMTLCETCAKELGIEEMNFNMPIHFSNFFEDLLGVRANDGFLDNFMGTKTLTCKTCGMDYDEFLKTGVLGCENCYDAFSNRIDSLLRNVHGTNRHVGRTGRLLTGEEKQEPKEIKKVKKVTEKEEKIESLKERLKQEIKEERYEEAAKTRDEIKKLEQ